MVLRLLIVCAVTTGVALAQPKPKESPKDPKAKPEAKAETPADGSTAVDALDPALPLDEGTRLRFFKQAQARMAELERMKAMDARRTKRLEALRADVETRYKALVLMQEELAAVTRADEGSEEQDAQKAAADAARRAKNVRRLAADVEKMKADEAGKMLKVMDRALAVDVIAQLKPKQAGKILGTLTPALAARLSEKMVDGSKKKKKGTP